MRILYLSCHSILEYDEFRILTESGHSVFSIGSYLCPKNPHSDLRPAINYNHDESILEQFHKMCHANMLNGIHLENHSKIFTPEFLNNFDCVISMHNSDWIIQNWNVMRNKIKIVRTIGQNTELEEFKIKEYINKGLHVVRYSPKERELSNFAGESTVIRFLKYKKDFIRRKDTEDNIVTFGQSVYKRKIACGGNYIEEISKTLPLLLYGPHNSEYPFSRGCVTYNELLSILSANRIYFNTGTAPAQYTLGFVEAMLSGIPVVSIGNKLANQDTVYPFEVPDILDRVNSTHRDTVPEIINLLTELLSNRKLTNEISIKQQEIADELFSVEYNQHLWNNFLKTL